MTSGKRKTRSSQVNLPREVQGRAFCRSGRFRAKKILRISKFTVGLLTSKNKSGIRFQPVRIPNSFVFSSVDDDEAVGGERREEEGGGRGRSNWRRHKKTKVFFIREKGRSVRPRKENTPFANFEARERKKPAEELEKSFLLHDVETTRNPSFVGFSSSSRFPPFPTPGEKEGHFLWNAAISSFPFLSWREKRTFINSGIQALKCWKRRRGLVWDSTMMHVKNKKEIMLPALLSLRKEVSWTLPTSDKASIFLFHFQVKERSDIFSYRIRRTFLHYCNNSTCEQRFANTMCMNTENQGTP